MRTLAMCLALITTLSGALVAHAQAGAAPAVATPAAATPAAATPAAATPAAATPAPATAEPAAAAAPATTEAPAAPASADEELERQKREADRARIRILLARAKAERAELDQQQGARPEQRPAAPQSEPVAVRHGDAGAAIAVGLSVEMPWHTERSFDLFSSNDVGERWGLWATYDLLALGESAFLSAGGGFDVESIESNNLYSGALDTELTAVVLYGTAVVRYVPTDWIQPHVRLSGGGQLVRSQLSFGNNDYKNEGDLPFGSLGAGFTLRTPSRLFESRRGDMASLSVGLMVEGGYALVAPLDMKVDGTGPDDRDIALIESELGELDRSGPFMRISLVARFF